MHLSETCLRLRRAMSPILGVEFRFLKDCGWLLKRGCGIRKQVHERPLALQREEIAPPSFRRGRCV